MKHSKPYNTHKAALESGTVGESFVNGMRRALHALDRKAANLSTSSTSSKMTRAELDDLLGMIYEKQPRIEPNQSAKGLAWLMDKWKTPRGVERKNNPYGYREQNVLANFSHFTLVDFYDAGNHYRSFFLPVYRVHSKDCGSFDYYAASWQSGGNGPSIIG